MALSSHYGSAADSRPTSASDDSIVSDAGPHPQKLWSEEVPSMDDPAFKKLISREPEEANKKMSKCHVFEPKDVHCGIWQDAPNPRCHASFGDRGTTASVSCFGNLVQMSQFLGAGRSGVFSMDHKLTWEPYLVCGRAEHLESLAKSQASPSFGLRLPEKYSPQQPPGVKWVNWRWPRYEWDTKTTGVKAHCQWVIHNGTVLQQVVLKNSSETPTDDIRFQVGREALIRDLDYLDDSYSFNDSNREGYYRLKGPNNLGWITVHELDPSDPGNEPSGNDSISRSYTKTSQESLVPDRMDQTPHINQESSAKQNDVPTVLRGASSEDLAKPLHSGNSQAVEWFPRPGHSAPIPGTSRANLSTYAQDHHLEFVGKEIDVTESRRHPHFSTGAEAEAAIPVKKSVDRPGHIEDTWSAKKPHSVASVTAFYCNGQAKEVKEGTIWTEGIPGKTPEIEFGVLEIVMGYKLVVLPDSKVHWRNFLITTEEADVSNILREETVRIWGESENAYSSLCQLGLSMVDPDETTGNAPSQENYSKSEDDATSDASNTRIRRESTPDLKDSQNGPGLGQTSNSKADPSPRPVLASPKGSPGKSSPKNQIEYMAWRHLEHILSVCAIPLLPCTLFDDAEGSKLHGSAVDGEIIALTCGDMSGHRICTSASFFAFQFLLEALSRLKKMEDSPYIVSLRSRIDSVCWGHVRWLEWLRKPWSPPEENKSLLESGSGCFAANYWLNGEIMPKGGESWQPPDSATDTPFQILKLASYKQFIDEEDDVRMERLMELLQDVSLPWLHEIDDLDRRRVFAWPHSHDDGINTYRLDDHVWIWRGLKALEEAGLWNCSPLTKSAANGMIMRSGNDRWIQHLLDIYGSDAISDEDAGLKTAFEKIPEVYRRLVPVDVQRGILQRFTIENEVARKRMLAVTRSPRDTRFLMHARDTALFYGYDRDFFMPDTSFKELWEGTVESQRKHEENLEGSWENVLRFSLGVVAGARGFSLNKKTPAELSRSSVLALIKAGSHNGFIPGEMDLVNGSPVLFSNEEDRDYYYHVGFESSHILLTDARKIENAFQPPSSSLLEGKLTEPKTSSDDKDAQIRHQIRREMTDTVRKEIALQPKRQKVGSDLPGSELELLLKRLETGGRADGQRTLMMKKAMVFNNNLIDARSIVNIDEEWLYVYPAFLVTKRIDLNKQLKSFVEQNSDQDILDSAGTVINQALNTYKTKFQRGDFRFENEDNIRNAVVFVANTPKQKRLSKREKRQQEMKASAAPLDNEQLWDVIKTARSANTAKKRFLWLPHANAVTALLCWTASTEAERPAMSLFFDRHSKFEKLLWDDTTLSRNVWQTELHLSFYVLSNQSQPHHVGLPSLEAPKGNIAFPGSSKKEIRRASMGFRFDGDFFDRYWTCHFIQYIPSIGLPGKSTPQKSWEFDFDSDGRGRYKDKHWWQRKVLELHLLQRILDAIITGSRDILDQARKELGVGETFLSFSTLNSEAYASSKDNWQKFEHILQAVEEDLTAILTTLQKWETREEDRGQEKPRWTRNDERKYRGYVDKFRGQTDRKIWELNAHRDNIRKLKDTLTTSREKIRDDLEIKREENIRYFTYVTVIFLPLGFAASFFSMNGAPEQTLIVSLVEFAAAAFAVTIALLFCAKAVFAAADFVLEPLKKVSKGAAQRLEQYSRSTRQESLLLRDRNDNYPSQEIRLRRDSSSSVGSSKPILRRLNVQETDVSRTWFWLAYFLLEIPARRLSLAIAVLKDGRFSPNAAGTILLGIFFLPVYGISRVLQITAHNILSLGRILGYARDLYNSPSPKPEDTEVTEGEHFRHYFTKMTALPPRLSPFKSFEEKLWEEKKARDEMKDATAEKPSQR